MVLNVSTAIITFFAAVAQRRVCVCFSWVYCGYLRRYGRPDFSVVQLCAYAPFEIEPCNYGRASQYYDSECDANDFPKPAPARSTIHLEYPYGRCGFWSGHTEAPGLRCTYQYREYAEKMLTPPRLLTRGVVHQLSMPLTLGDFQTDTSNRVANATVPERRHAGSCR